MSASLRGAGVTHGGVGLVTVRTRAAGRAVLKVSFPHPGNVHEPDALAAWGGRGAVVLHERHDERFALLLERVRTSTLAEVEDGDEVVAVAGRISRRLAVPPPGLPRLDEQADVWEEQLLGDAGELTHAVPRRVLDAAVATVRELGRSQPDTLIHGDLHARNILRADREPAVQRVLDVFAEAAELDGERVRRWAHFHAVQAAFWGRRHGFRIARSDPRVDRLTRFADDLAEILTGPS